MTTIKYNPLIQRRCIKLLNQQLEDKKTKNIIARREIKKDINGQTYINNMFLNIENDSYLGIKNTGLGTHLVRKQIETLLKIPEVEYIKMDAAGYGKEHVKGKNQLSMATMFGLVWVSTIGLTQRKLII